MFVHVILPVWLLAVRGFADSQDDDYFDDPGGSEDELWDAVVEYHGTYGGSGSNHPSQKDPNDVVFQEALRVAYGLSPDPNELLKNSHYNAVLITDRIASAICTVFSHCVHSIDYFRTDDARRPFTNDKYAVVRADDKRDISLVSCGIFDRCSPQYDIFALGLILYSKLSVPSRAFRVLDLSEVGSNWTNCRLHSYRKKKWRWNGIEEGLAGMRGKTQMYSVLNFKPLDPNFNCSMTTLNGHQFCGSVLDLHHEFCSMLKGGIVMCGGDLLGISQTFCGGSNYMMFENTTEFVIDVTTITKIQMEYWRFLEKKEDIGSGRIGASARVSPSIMLSIFAVSWSIYEYMISHYYEIEFKYVSQQLTPLPARQISS